MYNTEASTRNAAVVERLRGWCGISDSSARVRRLAEWAAAYLQCATSEEFDDLVTRPKRLVAPLVCTRFWEKGDGDWFDLALPGEATLGEIREAMGALPGAGDLELCVVSRLAERYEESWALCHDGREELPAQLFHNHSYRMIALVEGERWFFGLPMAYSLSSETAGIAPGEDEALRDVTLRETVDALLSNRILRSSCFGIPREAVDGCV